MRGRFRLLAVVAALTAALGPAGPADAAGIASDASVNTIAFTNDPAHPDQTVVTSSAVITRDPARRLVLTLSARPAGRSVRVTATVRNSTSSTVMMLPGGMRIEVVVKRDARPVRWFIPSNTTSLSAGQSVEVRGIFPLTQAGTYDMAGLVRYVG